MSGSYHVTVLRSVGSTNFAGIEEGFYSVFLFVCFLLCVCLFWVFFFPKEKQSFLG